MLSYKKKDLLVKLEDGSFPILEQWSKLIEKYFIEMLDVNSGVDFPEMDFSFGIINDEHYKNVNIDDIKEINFYRKFSGSIKAVLNLSEMHYSSTFKIETNLKIINLMDKIINREARQRKINKLIN